MAALRAHGALKGTLMRIPKFALLILAALMLTLAACESSGEETAAPPGTGSTPNTSIGAPLNPSPNAPQPTLDVNQPTPTLPTAQTAYCPNGGAIVPTPGEDLAAKVNGQPVPLGLYERQAAQAQAALVAQGLDPNTQNGKDAIQGMQQQVLGQLIDDVLIEQAAKSEKVTISDQDVNNRIQQMVNDVGGRDPFNQYLGNNQLQLSDLCTQIRASLYGDIMLNRVTAALPTQVEQVHAAHILLTTQAEANDVLKQLQAGKDFAALAKQYSQDEATRDNGGDLGWFPKGVMPPEFEAAAFQLQPGQLSGVVQSALGFHIIKVIERQPKRPLSGELLQNQKQQAFIAWLQAQRDKAKIEKFVNP
jgi:foldase protein PrsA